MASKSYNAAITFFCSILVALVLAETSRWRVRISLGRTPEGFTFTKTVNRQGGIVSTTTPKDNGLAPGGLEDLENQLSKFSQNGILQINFDEFEESDGDFGLVLDVTTNGSSPEQQFRNMQNLTINFRSGSQNFTLKNDTDEPRITTTPRTDTDSDSLPVPVIIAIVVGVLVGLMLIAFIVLAVLRHSRNPPKSMLDTYGLDNPISRSGTNTSHMGAVTSSTTNYYHDDNKNHAVQMTKNETFEDGSDMPDNNSSISNLEDNDLSTKNLDVNDPNDSSYEAAQMRSMRLSSVALLGATDTSNDA